MQTRQSDKETEAWRVKESVQSHTASWCWSQNSDAACLKTEGLQTRKWRSDSEAESFFVLILLPSEHGSQVNIAQGRKKRMRRRRKRKRGRIQLWLRTDFCLNGQIHTAGIRSWAFILRPWSFPCWPWLALGISASLKPLPIRGWLSCSLPRLLIRGCWPLKTQLGSSSLVLSRTSWDGFKGWKAICSFCVEGRGVWEGVLLLAGELIRPSNCLVISQVTWKPSETREWGGWRPLCAQQAARCLCASGRFGKWGLGRPVLNNPQKIYQMDSPRVVALYLHPAADCRGQNPIMLYTSSGMPFYAELLIMGHICCRILINKRSPLLSMN